jgi:hypothetical protein
VTNRLTSLAGPTEDQSVLTSGRTTSKLVKSDALTTSLGETSTSSLSESEGSDSSLGDLKKTVVVSDSADNDDGLVLSALLSKSAGDTSNRNRRAVDLRKEERTKNDLVELRVGSSSKETVELDKKLQVNIVRLGSSAVTGALVLLSEQILSHVE